MSRAVTAVPQLESVPRYRYDIDGLRALAIALVVIYHVWFGRVSGGVDVFLMISAFFLTASLVRRTSDGERIKLSRYWSNRFRRLVPPAAVTILGVLIAAYVVFPQSDWPQIWRESWASLFYFENWALAFGEVDYYHLDGSVPSPLQHFWSLSVQGQVFILFPSLIALIGWLCWRKRTIVRPLLIVVFTAVFAASLWFSIVETQTNQMFAYFDTRTRVWEFAAGALVALLLPLIRVRGWLAAVLGWVGVAGIISCGIVLDVQGGFPGYLALWPILSTAAVIIGGTNPVHAGPTRVLASAPLRFIGKDAYALYLVHWPVLITWRVQHADAPISFFDGLIIVAISVVLARVLTWLVDGRLRKPIRSRYKVSRALMPILASVALVSTPLALWERTENDRVAEIIAQYEADKQAFVNPTYPGAAALFGGVEPPLDVPIMPLPSQLKGEWLHLPEDCVGTLVPTDRVVRSRCTQTPGTDEADRVIMVVGDSHAQQLMAPLVASAERQGIGVVAVTLHGCNVGLDEEVPQFQSTEVCEAFRLDVRDYLIEQHPSAVYVPVTRSTSGEQDHLLAGVEEFLAPIIAADIDVIAVRSNPRFDASPYHCVLNTVAAAPLYDASGLATTDQPVGDAGVPQSSAVTEEANVACSTQRDLVLSDVSPLDALDPAIIKVDFSPWICPDDTCPAIIGNMAVYYDNWHIGRTYGETLAPVLEQQLIAGGVLTQYSGLVPSDEALAGTEFLTSTGG